MMLHDLNLSLPEFIAVLLALGGIVGVWISTKVKIAKIETTLQLKIAAIELSIASYIQTNSENLRANAETVHCSFADNKEEHRSLMSDVKEIKTSINSINVQIAKLAK